MRVMFPNFLFTAALIALPICLSAQETKPTERLRAVLQQMPAPVFSLSDPILAVFVDSDVASHETGERARSSLGGMIRPLEALLMAGPDAWSAAAGISADSIGSFLTFGQPPKNSTIWGQLAGVEKLLVPKLKELGFTPVTDLLGIYGNGEPMAIDFAKRSPGDPWRGTAGQASFIAFDNAEIIQSTTPEAVAAIRAAKQPVGDLASVKLSLDAIDSLAGDASIGQALLFSTAAGLDAGLPAGLLTEDPKALEDLAAALKAEIETPKPGIPLYFGGLLADTRIDGAPALLISVSYPTCDLAAEAADGIATLWQTEEIGGKTMADRVPGSITKDHVARDGLCAAIVTIKSAANPDAPHPFDFAVNTFMRGSFPLLRIALK